MTATPLDPYPHDALDALDTSAGNLRIVDPSTGEIVGDVAQARLDEVDDAVVRARGAQDKWRRTAPAARGAVLRAVATAMRDVADDLARWNARETGKLIGDALGGVEAGAATVAQYAELGPLHRGRLLLGAWDASDFMVPEPYGTVAVITPWNDPVAVTAGLVAAALVTGNTVVLKPSERCPHTATVLADVFAAHLPPGALSVVHGDGTVGDALASHPGIDVVAHVGSTAAGRSIAAATARTGAKALLENGGKDALIVDDGIDPAWAAQQAAIGAFANTGQICTAVERIYATAAIAEPFLEALVGAARDLGYGAALDTGSRMGPLVDTRQRDHVHEHVRHAVADGAELLCGGEIPSGPGAFYPATVLRMPAAAGATPLLAVETFGPVAPVRVVADFDAALAEAGSGRYGLAATVLTPSMEHAQRAWRELDVGTVKVNAVFGGAPGGSAQPRRASGQGFGYGPELLDEFTRMKVVHLEPAPAEGKRDDDDH